MTKKTADILYLDKRFNMQKIDGNLPERVLICSASSHIQKVAWFEDNTMLVTFANGSNYRYFDIGVSVFGDLAGAESVGKAFNSKVRDKFAYTKDGM